MKKTLLLLLIPLALMAKLNVAVSYPFIGAMVETIGKERVDVTVLASGQWDPHFVVPRPSLITKVRRADALIINGGQLEIGWMPPLLRRASNPKTRPSADTFLNLGHYMDMIQKPKNVDRSQGDVHPDGNPHFHLDPRNILKIAYTITAFLNTIDPANKDFYTANYDAFVPQWKKHIKRWFHTMEDAKGAKIVQFHDNLAYFNRAFGLVNIGTIEPLPGIPPSSKHTFKLIQKIKKNKPYAILHDVYHSTKTAKFIVNKTGIKLIIMPHDIEALDSIHDLVELFDYLVGHFHD